MSASHVPSGHCPKCRYPMDPGTCPECGTVAADVGPPPRRHGLALLLAMCVGAGPIPWAVVTSFLSRLVYSRMTSGLVPGDTRFNRAWEVVSRWAEVGYFAVLPLLMAGLVIAAAACARVRWRSSWEMSIAAAAIATVLGAVAWCVGFLGLVVELWNA